MNKKNSYIFSADIIRVIAIAGVVTIHTANAVYTRLDFFGGATWWLALILDSISRISIPLFIMLSGFLILRKDESLERSLKRIFFRIVIPLLFWIPFYFWLGTGLPSFSYINISILQRLFSSNVYHLYFLIIVLGLYFTAPIISLYLRMASPTSQKFFMKVLLILGIAEVALQFIFRTCAADNLFTRWLPYSGLFVAGYVLGNTPTRLNRHRLLLIYTCAFAVTLSLNYLHYVLSLRHNSFFEPTGCLSNYTDHYLSINVVVMSLCSFLLLFHRSYDSLKNNTVIRALVNSIARASFGIYIVHPVVARFLEIQFHLAVDFSPLPIALILLLKLCLVFVLSYAIAVIASRIPVVKLVFGVIPRDTGTIKSPGLT